MCSHTKKKPQLDMVKPIIATATHLRFVSNLRILISSCGGSKSFFDNGKGRPECVLHCTCDVNNVGCSLGTTNAEGLRWPTKELVHISLVEPQKSFGLC